MAKLEIRSFGDLQLRLDGASLVDFSSEKGKALLCYLAVTRQPHSRAALAGLLWPESSEENARASLRRTLTGIRKMTPDCLNTTRQTVAVNAEAPIWVDVIRFEELLVAATTIGPLQEAGALYRGDFLEQFYLPDAPAFDRWVLGQRARLRQKALEALHTLAVHFAETREYDTAVSYARQMLDIEPWREDGHRELMRLLALSGQRSAALKQYELCCQMLADELGVAPAAETTSLYERIRDEELGAGLGPESLAPGNGRHVRPGSPSRPVHNLPAAATPFVGREAELAALTTLIADPHVRIITIAGPGGMGKTRLALEAAGRELGLPSPFPDGVFFVSLAPLESADDIVTALAADLGFQFQGSGKESEQLLNYLRQKQMLLIMDNFEHILGGQALLAEISSRAAGITLLVTSRERLQMRGEQLFPLHGLALAQSADSAPEASSTRLFLQTARRNRPDFQILEGDAEHLLRICRLVEGMPLGLELAASWVSLLPLSEIAAELERSLDLLVAEHSDVPQRHQSMEAALDVSWRRLTSEQQRAFQELTVFQGGFTREAAVAVANASLSLLVTLANKSWLSYDRQQDRYQIHELLRQYGSSKLGLDSSKEERLRERHSAYFCDFLKEREMDWFGPRQQSVASEVRDEIDNIRPAWRWAATRGDDVLLLKGLNSLCQYYHWEGRERDGENACRLASDGLSKWLAVHQVDDVQRLALRSRVLAWESDFAIDVERKEKLLAESQQFLDRATQTGRDTQAEQAHLYLFKSYTASQTDLEETRQLASLGLEMFRDLNDKVGEAEALKLVGTSHLFQGDRDLDLAIDFLHDSLAISRQLGDLRGASVTMSFLGMAARHIGDFEEAETITRSGLSLNRQLGNRFNEEFSLFSLSVVLIQSGNFLAAQEAGVGAIRIARDLGVYPDSALINALATATLHLGEYSDAQAMAAESRELAKQKGNLLEAGWALECLGEISFVKKDAEQAKRYLQESVAIMKELRHVYQALAQAALGYVFRASGEVEQAQRSLLSSLRMGAKKHSVLPIIMCLPTAALLAADDDRLERAAELYSLARQFGHISNSRWYNDVACRELDEVTASLPADVAKAAEARGRQLDVWQTAESLRTELAVMG